MPTSPLTVLPGVSIRTEYPSLLKMILSAMKEVADRSTAGGDEASSVRDEIDGH